MNFIILFSFNQPHACSSIMWIVIIKQQTVPTYESLKYACKGREKSPTSQLSNFMNVTRTSWFEYEQRVWQRRIKHNLHRYWLHIHTRVQREYSCVPRLDSEKEKKGFWFWVCPPPPPAACKRLGEVFLRGLQLLHATLQLMRWYHMIQMENRVVFNFKCLHSHPGEMVHRPLCFPTHV